jgi:hypothetical protein
MNPADLEAIGCQKIHWNPAYNGGFYEYYLPLSGNGRGVYDARLSVEYDGIGGPGMIVLLRIPGATYPVRGVTTIAQFQMLYALLGGKA